MKKKKQISVMSSYGAKTSSISMPIEAKFNYAVSFFQNKSLADAKKLLKEILSINSKHAESWFLFALIANEELLPQDAINYLENALNIDPKNLKYIYTLGEVYYDNDYLNEGVVLFESLINANSEDHNAYYNLASFQQKQKKYTKSLENYNKVLEMDEDNVNAIYNIGNILIDIKDYFNAVEYFKKVIEFQPNSDDALNNVGFLQMELGNFEVAIKYLNKAISINSNNFSALNNLGKACEKKLLYLEAIEYFDAAIRLKPDYPETYSNRGVIFKELKIYESALNDFDKAILLDSQHAEARYNKAILLLQLQQLDTGWYLYQWRWGIKTEFSKKLETNIPAWDGRALGKQIKILFWAEQGIGDEIFYFGMLNIFTKIDAQVTVSADVRLHSLFKRSMPEVEFIDKKEIMRVCDEIAFDYQTPIGDIGHLCSVDKLLLHKSPKPFLNINNSRSSHFKNNNHFLSDKFVCGISWKSTNKDIGTVKSLNLIDLFPLLSIENVEFVSLQYGSSVDEIELVEKSIGRKIHTIAKLDIFNDIDGLTSLISNCDCVVTTSNITAHLTGAIGKKGMVLVPYSKGRIWYWHSGEGQNLWYPSLELVSQSKMNDWTDPINKCTEWVLGQL
jgi:tetratricopeptide (TPR) repeat protein